LAHYEDKIKFAARELNDLQILLQEKDTILAEKEETARLANSMENIARSELKYSERREWNLTVEQCKQRKFLHSIR
jgi:hypothetical protein